MIMMKQFDKIWLASIDDIIDANLKNPDFQLIDITSKLAISRAKLYRKITKLTGNSPAEYIRKKRLTKALEILEIGVYPTVKETSAAVGFRSPEYFSKLFFQTYKKLPSEFLK